MNGGEFWRRLENVRGQTAALFDWRFHFDKWSGLDEFRSKYLYLFPGKACTVECMTKCREGAFYINPAA